MRPQSPSRKCPDSSRHYTEIQVAQHGVEPRPSDVGHSVTDRDIALQALCLLGGQPELGDGGTRRADDGRLRKAAGGDAGRQPLVESKRAREHNNGE
jgi:hypothetical protein